MSYLDALNYILPEVAMTFGLCVVLIWDLAVRRGRRWWETGFLTLGFLAVTAVLLVQRFDYPPATVFGMVRVDLFATLFKLFLVLATGVVVAFQLADRNTGENGRSETHFLLLCAVLGGFFLVSADNFILMYLGLETLGLSSYALAGMAKRSVRGSEAALKYVVYGALASGVMLFGLSLFYGMSGTLSYGGTMIGVSQALANGQLAQVAVATLMVLVGFGFKLSLFPFQWWAPDVYQGVSTPVASFLAVGSKGIAVAAMLRVVATTFGIELHAEAGSEFAGSLSTLLALLAVITMIFGNFAALRQTDLKRMLAYSSIAHAGYILAAMAALTPEGFHAAGLYTLLYGLMTLGIFGTVLYFANIAGHERIEGLKGLGYRHPVAGAATGVFLASLTGLPPTAGFGGKYYLLTALWESGHGLLALVVALMSVVSLFYYFRIAKALYLKKATAESKSIRMPVLAGILALLALANVWFLQFGGLLTGVQQAWGQLEALVS